MQNEMKKIIYIIIFLAFAGMTNGQWVQMSNGMGTNIIIPSLAFNGNNIFAGTDNYGVYISANNGINWTQCALNRYAFTLATLGNNIFAGTNNGVYLSTNNGTSWNQSAFDTQDIPGLAIFGNDIFAGTWYNSGTYGVYLSTNNGTNWTYCGLNGQTVNSFAKLNNNLFAGTRESRIYLSTNNGTNWTQTAFDNQSGEVYSLGTLGNNIFAGSDSGIYLSTNNGISWTLNAFDHQPVSSFAIIGSNIIAGGVFGIYLSTNNGTNWIDKNQGLNGTQLVKTLLIANNYVFAGTWGQSIWRRPLSEVIGIQTTSTEIPSAFSLQQNYPNPFNPSTFIKFDVSEGSFLTLKIFDALGREVAILVNEDLKPGTYEVDWNAINYPSGVYFYTLRTEQFTETKRMVLIK